MSHTLPLMGPLPSDVMDTRESTCTVHRHREADDGAALLERIADECTGVVTETVGSVDAGGRAYQGRWTAKARKEQPGGN